MGNYSTRNTRCALSSAIINTNELFYKYRQMDLQVYELHVLKSDLQPGRRNTHTSGVAGEHIN